MKNQTEAAIELGDIYFQKLNEQAKGTFYEYLGCEVVSILPDKVVLKLEAGPHHLNVLGIVHGGVQSSLLDSVMGLAVMLARPGDKTVTSNLNVHFVAPLHAGELRATAEIAHETRRTITCSGHVVGTDGQLGALATATFRII